MSTSRHQKITRRKRRRIARRLHPRTGTAQATPMYPASNIKYEHRDRVRGLASGIRAMHRLAQHTGLVAALDVHVELLKKHLPHHESDHVLGIAYKCCAGVRVCRISRCGDRTRCNSMRWRRSAFPAQRIPDPTTAGDFCRRFDEPAIEALRAAINETRVRVWRAQPAAFLDEAVIDADGTLTESSGQCKERMDVAYNVLAVDRRTNIVHPPMRSRV